MGFSVQTFAFQSLLTSAKMHTLQDSIIHCKSMFSVEHGWDDTALTTAVHSVGTSLHDHTFVQSADFATDASIAGFATSASSAGMSIRSNYTFGAFVDDVAGFDRTISGSTWFGSLAGGHFPDRISELHVRNLTVDNGATLITTYGLPIVIFATGTVWIKSTGKIYADASAYNGGGTVVNLTSPGENGGDGSSAPGGGAGASLDVSVGGNGGHALYYNGLNVGSGGAGGSGASGNGSPGAKLDVRERMLITHGNLLLGGGGGGAGASTNSTHSGGDGGRGGGSIIIRCRYLRIDAGGLITAAGTGGADSNDSTGGGGGGGGGYISLMFQNASGATSGTAIIAAGGAGGTGTAANGEGAAGGDGIILMPQNLPA